MAYEISLFSDGNVSFLAVSVQAGPEGIAAGQICSWSQAAPGRIRPAPTAGNEHDLPAGVAVSDFVADGWGWLATGGVVYVLPESGVTAAAGWVILCSDEEAGRASQRESVPPAIAYNVVGRWIENGAGPGVPARAMLS